MEERNQISLEELTEKIDNRMEKIYSLILKKMEDAMDDQKQHLKCLFNRISAIENRLRPEYKEIINKK